MAEEIHAYIERQSRKESSLLSPHNLCISASALLAQNMEATKGNEFLRKVVRLILDEYAIVGNGNFMKQRHSQIIEFSQPKQLEKSWDTSIKREAETEQNLLNMCRKVIAHSVKTTHPNFYNQLYGGVDEYGLAGAWLTDALNTSAATYEISPVFTIMERTLINYCGKLIGYSDQSIDGMFCAGGSMANIYAMVLARHKAFPHTKQKGVRHCGDIVAFVSEESHYSFVKGAIWLGHGSDSVIKVKADNNGRMIPEQLERSISEAIKANRIPYLVCATSGTTVLGAFDPLPQISDICAKYGLWFHVDAALGGTCLFSRTHRHLLDGISSADSVTWDLHKMACVPFQCSLIVTPHTNILIEANSLRAEYLFQSDKYYDASYDSGDKSIQCGRKVDSLKLWLAIKAHGEDGIESAVDNVFDMAKYMTEKLRNTEGFRLVLPEYESNNICFWYIPSSMRRHNAKSNHTNEMIGKVAPIIKKRMMESGKLMISYQPLSTKSLPNFFRLTLSCFPKPTKQDMDFIIEEFERLGNDIDLESVTYDSEKISAVNSRLL